MTSLYLFERDSITFYMGGDVMKVGFVGAGKVGFSLGKFLSDAHVNISGYYSRSLHSAKEAAIFTNSKVFNDLSTLIYESDAVFLTVPDDAIAPVWESMKKLPISEKMICHCSGSLSSRIFSDIEKLGAYGFSIHPLLAVSDRYVSYQNFSNALFTIEGSAEKLDFMRSFLVQAGINLTVINADAKVRYHASAVIASNLVVALIKTAEDELIKCGFTEDNLQKALAPLITLNVSKVLSMGPEKALTGPIERCDLGTVQKHLDILDESSKEIYTSLSKKALEIAKKKHTEYDYSKIEKLLSERE